MDQIGLNDWTRLIEYKGQHDTSYYRILYFVHGMLVLVGRYMSLWTCELIFCSGTEHAVCFGIYHCLDCENTILHMFCSDKISHLLACGCFVTTELW